MDIIAGLVTAAFFFYLFFVSEKIKIHKKFSTALLIGFITFVLFTKKTMLFGQRIGVIIISLILIYAINLEIKKETDHQELDSVEKNENK